MIHVSLILHHIVMVCAVAGVLTLGARAEDAPTSPPVARRVMTLVSLGSIFGGIVSEGARADGLARWTFLMFLEEGAV